MRSYAGKNLPGSARSKGGGEGVYVITYTKEGVYTGSGVPFIEIGIDVEGLDEPIGHRISNLSPDSEGKGGTLFLLKKFWDYAGGDYTIYGKCAHCQADLTINGTEFRQNNHETVCKSCNKTINRTQIEKPEVEFDEHSLIGHSIGVFWNENPQGFPRVYGIYPESATPEEIEREKNLAEKQYMKDKDYFAKQQKGQEVKNDADVPF